LCDNKSRFNSIEALNGAFAKSKAGRSIVNAISFIAAFILVHPSNESSQNLCHCHIAGCVVADNVNKSLMVVTGRQSAGSLVGR
jgi:hypothetical protein